MYIYNVVFEFSPVICVCVDVTAPCVTADCVKVASVMLRAMDTTADPCEDFYQYACGSWIKQNAIPAGNSRYSTFDALSDSNELVLRNLLG